MENKNRAWFIVCAIIAFCVGISFCCTLLLIPFAIYCFIGAKKYMTWADMSEAQVAAEKQSIKNWAIYISIVGFPLGLLSIVPACLVGNNVTVSNVSEEKTTNQEQEPEIHTEKREPVKNELGDLETIEKLKKLLDEGLITEEEFERAKKEVLDKE